MKTLFKLLVIALVFTSCEDVEPVIYNGNYEQNDTFLSFSKPVYTLPIERDGVGELNVVFNSSTVTDTDRVYNIEVALPDNSSAANPLTFSVPPTVTILAGSYQGFFTVTGVDNNLVDEVIKTFTMTITNSDPSFEYADSLTSTVNVYEVCPLLSPFLGTYSIEVAEVYFSNLPAFKASQVELKEGDTPYERVFSAIAYPGYAGSEDVVIAFACDYLNLGKSIDTGVRCSAEDDNGLTFAPVPLVERSAYDTTNDSYFEMTFIENAKPTSCTDGSPRNTVLRFTKVD